MKILSQDLMAVSEELSFELKPKEEKLPHSDVQYSARDAHVATTLLISMAASRLSKSEEEKFSVTEAFLGFGMKSPIHNG